MPVFTIGNEQEYDTAMRDGVGGNGITPIVKRGKYTQADGTQYNGGYAFKTVALAYAYIDKIGKGGVWAAYEMDAAWPDDVWHGHPDDEHMVLKRDAILVRKVARPAAGTPEPASLRADDRLAGAPDSNAAHERRARGLAASVRSLMRRWFG